MGRATSGGLHLGGSVRSGPASFDAFLKYDLSACCSTLRSVGQSGFAMADLSGNNLRAPYIKQRKTQGVELQHHTANEVGCVQDKQFTESLGKF